MNEQHSGIAWPGVASRVVLAGLFGLLVVACGEQGADTAEEVAQARRHADSGEWRAAIIELKNVLQKAPDNADARLLLGRVHVRTGNGAAAEKELQRALRFGKREQEVAYWHARAVFQQGEFNRLLEEIEVSSEWPADVRARVLAVRARAEIATGDLAGAEASLEQAEAVSAVTLEARLARLQLALAHNRTERAQGIGEALVEEHPESGRAWGLLGRAHLARGELERADDALGHAIELIVHPYRERLLRAQLRLGLGDAEGARTDIEWLSKNAGEHPAVLFAEGLLALAEDNRDDACARFSQALAKAPDMREARYYVGVCHFRDGEYNQATANLENAYQGASRPRVGRMLAATYLAQGRYERAREVLRPVLRANPEDMGALALMARTESAQGNTSEALDYLRRLAELRPDDPGIQLQLGMGLLQAGEYEEGRSALGDVLALDPDSGPAGALLVITHLREGEFEQAMNEARRLAEEQPEASLPLTLQGVVLMAQGEREAARERLQEALERDPADPGARHALARMALQENDAEAARRHFEAVLDQRPGHTSTLLQLAELEARSGHPERIEPLLERAHGSAPEALRPRVLLARFALGKGEHARALELLEGVEGSARNDPRVLVVQANAYLRMEQPLQALEPLRRLMEQRPEAPLPYLLLARAYGALGEEQQALEQLDRILEFDPDNPFVLLVQARAKVRQGEFDRAGELLSRVPEERRGHPWYLDTRGNLALRAGEHDQALDYYRRAYEASPSGTTVAKAAAAYRSLGKAGAAEALLQQHLQRQPDDFEAHQALGGLYVEQGRDVEAAEAYKTVLQHDPGSVEALNNLGWVLRKENPNEALRYAEHALTLRPDDPRIIDTVGTVYLELGEPEQAIAHMRKAVTLAPEAPVLRYHLARALAAAGNEHEARLQLRDALEAGAAFAGVEDARALLERLNANP